MEREIQKQEYAKALRDQMDENYQKKYANTMKVKQNDYRFDQDSSGYFPFGKQGGGAPRRDEQGNIMTMRAGYFNDQQLAHNNPEMFHSSHTPPR